MKKAEKEKKWLSRFNKRKHKFYMKYKAAMDNNEFILYGRKSLFNLLNQ
jgi:hypothetical protein